MRRLDYAEYGCAPLLGVQGISTIGHGKSSSKAIRNAIFRAASCVEHQINQEIEKSLIAAGVAE
jgi:glycerol-3-phosphate acyltransferase PlsX